MPRQAREIDRYLRRKLHVNQIAMLVALAGIDAQDVLAPADDVLTKQKPRGQFVVMIARPHGDADGPPADADFQRLFHRQVIAALNDAAAGPMENLHARAAVHGGAL